MVFAIEGNYLNPDRSSINGIINNTINEPNRKYSETYTEVESK